MKSLSRFGRDTVETIKQIRRLKHMNIGVYIETGGINTLTTSDSIIDQLAALDQAESQSRSENIKFGIRHRMRSARRSSTTPNFSVIPKDLTAYCRLYPRKLKLSEKFLSCTSRVMGCGRSKSIWRVMASRRLQGNQNGVPLPSTGC